MWGGWGCRSLPPALADPSYLSPQTPPFLASGLGVTRGPNGAIAKTKPEGCRGCFGRGGASGGFSSFFPTKCFLRHAGLFWGVGFFGGGCEDRAASRQLKSMRSPRCGNLLHFQRQHRFLSDPPAKGVSALGSPCGCPRSETFPRSGEKHGGGA